MQDILPMLEAHEGVYKYSWFMNRYTWWVWRENAINKKCLNYHESLNGHDQVLNIQMVQILAFSV